MANFVQRPARRSQLRTLVTCHGFTILLFTLIAMVFTYPALLQARSAIGGQLDALENYWNLWWTYEAVVRRGVNPFRAINEYHPFGLSLLFHTYNPLNGVLSLPIQAVLGTAAAYNLLNVFAFTMAALGMYALVWRLTQRRASAVVAGLIYGFSPYMTFHLQMGQTNLLSLQWLPWYVWALLRALHGRRRWTLAAAVALLLNALTDWHYVVFALVITLITGVYEIVRLRRLHPVLELSGRLALIGGLWLLLVAPLLVPMVNELRTDPAARRPLQDSIWHSTDLLALLLPSPFHPLWGAWAGRIFFGRLVPPFIVGGIASVGVVTVALALYGLIRNRSRSAVWALLALVSGVLALGPYLQINGVNSSATSQPIPLPFLLFRELPYMDVLRIPSRFVAVLMLALAVLAGFGVAALLQQPGVRRRSRRVQHAIALVPALLVLFEFWPTPFRTTPVGPDQVSPFYRQLGADPAEYAIAEVPYRTPRSLFYQTYHRKNTLGGSRGPSCTRGSARVSSAR